MPLYEYKCDDCGAVSEFQMKMSDAHPESCPKCGAGSLRKLISQTAFQLKGGGWYNEGYTGPSNKKPEAKPKEASDKAPAEATSPSKSSNDKASSSKAKSTGTE